MVVAYFLNRQFKINFRSRDKRFVSSFFKLSEFVQEVNLNSYSRIYSFWMGLSLWMIFFLLFISDTLNNNLLIFLNSAQNFLSYYFPFLNSVNINFVVENLNFNPSLEIQLETILLALVGFFFIALLNRLTAVFTGDYS